MFDHVRVSAFEQVMLTSKFLVQNDVIDSPFNGVEMSNGGKTINLMGSDEGAMKEALSWAETAIRGMVPLETVGPSQAEATIGGEEPQRPSPTKTHHEEEQIDPIEHSPDRHRREFPRSSKCEDNWQTTLSPDHTAFRAHQQSTCHAA